MNPRMLCIGALGTMLVSGGASAVGFGDIVLLSRIGEPLRAEVPILANSDESVDAACFSLANIRNSELPVISRARFRLARDGVNARLSITGSEPISEPVFVIGLRAHCGVDLQRDYVLMPSPPLMLAQADDAAPATTAPPRKPRNFLEWNARPGDTLASIAELQSVGNLAEQQRLLSALKRANPDIADDEVLSEGRVIRIPNLAHRPAERLQATAPSSSVSRESANEPAPSPRTRKARPATTTPVANQNSKADRLVLGLPPEDIVPQSKAIQLPASASEVENRMLKLETTLSTLNQEVDKLNSALALATEALATQQQLMTAQNLQNPSSSEGSVHVVTPTQPPTMTSSHNNWLELLISALVGGGIAAGIARLLSPRGARGSIDALAADREALPRGSTGSVIGEASTAGSSTLPVIAPTPSLAVDIPVETSPVALEEQDDETVSVDFNDGNSALALAEIMLTFGRIQGAAETLAMHIEEKSPDNIQPWAMLLDLYRRSDMRAEFESLAATMCSRFNVRIPSWEESPTPISGLKSLEDYAHIVWRITNCWGKQECMDYLYELVHDNRAGNRSGFPLEVIEEIALLMGTLEEGYGLCRHPA